MIGYAIFASCIILFIIVYIAVRNGIEVHSFRNMIFGGGTAGPMTLTFSIFAAWMWTTSVFGSAETYSIYGIWGPISYVVGACIAFGGLVGVLAFMRKRYPNSITWLNFMQVRYGSRTKIGLYIFAIIVPAYVLVEQGVGIAYVLESFYGCSFRIISFLSVIIAMGFVFIGGMKFVLAEEKIAALIIISGFAVGAVYVITCGDMSLIEVHNSSEDAAVSGGPFWIALLQYFFLAIIIAFGQIAFDPAYYIKAHMAHSTRDMRLSFLIGGIVIWGLITLAASIYMGHAAAVTGNDIMDMFRGPARAIFTFIIIAIGMSTIAHFMIGLLGVFSKDLYETVVKPSGSDKERIVFGRIMMIAFGLTCASVTIALENISLLTIDVFCAIFFTAPCVPLVVGCLSQRNFGKLPIIATVLGIIGGLVVWIAMPNSLYQDQVAGVVVSIALSLAIMTIGLVRRLPYNG